MNHSRFDYSPLVDRKPYHLPNGARVALWVIPNIEHFHFDMGGTPIVSTTTGLVPDVLNYSWRDYGNRVGVWRMMDIMEKYGVKGSATLNSEVCELYPQIMEAGMKLEWEWLGHGQTNSRFVVGMEEEEERAIIRDVRDTIMKATGKAPKGWLGPALSETFNTPDLLAEEGFEYVADWVNDDQPYPMKVRNNSLCSIPYSIEINDITAFLGLHRSSEEFAQMIIDQFDVLYEDGASTGRVMSICLHPFLIGHPHRSKYLDKALKHITSREDVWIATGGEIIEHYKESYLKQSVSK
ncbi:MULTISPECIES: polysaccharide deacetylase family protein [unclassified Paenibacillus]|uniref:polysaccharide deacetylase family protein n=1 Tax=unclassified Paenibacillus TaxID=185978 RepID=UPI0024075919|nr:MULTISPECIES: polysaccharide deacetylase family protein [unclassified Paenibacillus]MDF9839790.1 allantoinase [Paenibacillus sp. PastF-2]MDF9846371.1 allantoinase [Paenibacillus sp. PastM-2]MDF9853280.1 allantoinase [Paenibacillus sp. PastF-1]MDH6478216.1 allantoinase [Paenibacillus sp. PastH-2]MDH6506285.1 allantoinase [Paenibacillus sp. PastM-3]